MEFLLYIQILLLIINVITLIYNIYLYKRRTDITFILRNLGNISYTQKQKMKDLTKIKKGRLNNG